MRKTVFVVIPLALVLPFSIAQAARKATRTSSASAHLPSVAIASLEKIEPEHIRAHVRFLSHDLLEGRGTGQRGGDIAAEYIATQFWLYGLKAAGDNGTFFQLVYMLVMYHGNEATLEGGHLHEVLCVHIYYPTMS